MDDCTQRGVLAQELGEAMTYCFRCPTCHVSVELGSRKTPVCRGTKKRPHATTVCKRDWQAEGARVNVANLRVSTRQVTP